ncbi:MAG: hypothetical protein MUO26_07995 [Methanotrichaceae archaeon]|nr:hypothetical protein [Methanotrichaceae archaeon]
MRLLYVICIVSLMFLAIPGSMAEENTGINVVPSIPKENLPVGFKLIAIKNASTQGVNITQEIKDFFGAEDFGPFNATIGTYSWAPLGTLGTYDSKITLLSLADENKAKAAISNYMSLPKFKKPPYKDVNRFSSAIINAHNATEIRDAAGIDELQYLYLWNNGNVAVLVEGNGDRSNSLELASATKL